MQPRHACSRSLSFLFLLGLCAPALRKPTSGAAIRTTFAEVGNGLLEVHGSSVQRSLACRIRENGHLGLASPAPIDNLVVVGWGAAGVWISIHTQSAHTSKHVVVVWQGGAGVVVPIEGGDQSRLLGRERIHLSGAVRTDGLRTISEIIVNVHGAHGGPVECIHVGRFATAGGIGKDSVDQPNLALGISLVASSLERIGRTIKAVASCCDWNRKNLRSGT